MNILILPSYYPTEWDPLSGTYFMDQVLALRKAGLNAGVAYFDGRSLRKGMSLPAIIKHRFQPVFTEEQNIPTVRILGWNTLRQYTAITICGVRHLVRAGKCYIDRYGRPDIIHAFQGRWAGYAAYLLAGELRLPYVITEHESYFEEGKIPASAIPYLCECYRAANRVFAVSRAMAKAMHRVCAPEHIQIIPNMVDTDYFTPASEPRAHEPFIFLSVARLAKIKRLDVLIKAFHLAFADDPAVRLRFVGEGAEYPLLVRMVRHLSLQQQVDFCGALPHPRVKEEMQRAHCLILCSDVETFGLVLIEAIACGLPVIATNCGGPEDFVTDEVGLLVNCDDPRKLANAMQQMRHAHHRYTPALLHDFAEQHFGEQVIAARMFDEYEKIVNEATSLCCRGQVGE